MGDSDGKHYFPGRDFFAIIQSERESISGSPKVDDQLIFKLRNHSLLECQTISDEGFELHRLAGIGVFDSSILTIGFQGKASVRVAKVTGESIGLQQHAFGHVIFPAVHGAAEYTKRHSNACQVSRN